MVSAKHAIKCDIYNTNIIVTNRLSGLYSVLDISAVLDSLSVSRARFSGELGVGVSTSWVPEERS